ncbi:MAG: hypothetical protein ACI9TI_001212, partial [Natronomonas sp.]
MTTIRPRTGGFYTQFRRPPEEIDLLRVDGSSL